MKRIKVRVKKPHKVSDELAEKIFYQGKCLTNFGVVDRKGIVFCCYTVRYKQKTYFLVSADLKVKECIEI